MNRTAIIQARCLPEERTALAAIAKQERRKLSEALRELVRAEAQRRGLWLSNEDIQFQQEAGRG
jgi:hypothetical protein